jgi:hypothetical protein
VDERSFWIFVGGSPGVYGVAVSDATERTPTVTQ